MNKDYLGKLVEAALASEKVFTLEQHGNKYMRKEDIVTQVYELPDMPDGAYQELSDYLDNDRGIHNLGQSFDFFPPVVAVDKRGTYYQLFTLPTIAIVTPIVEEVMSDTRRIAEAPDRPVEFIFADSVTKLAFFDYGGSLAEVETSQPRYTQFRSCVQHAMNFLGWEYDEMGDRFTRERPMDVTKDYWTKVNFNGKPVHKPWNLVSKDVYGRPYNLDLDQFPQEFQDYFAEQLVKYGYVWKDGNNYVPVPVEFPDEIEGIGEEILSDPHLLVHGKYGSQALPFETIRKVLWNDHAIVVNNRQIEAQLIGRDGEWRAPLVMNGFNLSHSSLWVDSFENYEPEDDEEAYAEFLVKHRKTTSNPTRKHDFAAGLPVVINSMFIDPVANELVYFDMVGAESSVRANWAALVQDRQMSFRGSYFKVGSMRNHRLFKATLPSGLRQWSLINKAASPQEISPASIKCYITTPDKRDDVPANFIGVMDKFLTIPLMEGWANELWTIGRITGLVSYTGDPNKQIGGTCWTIRRGQNNDSWENLITAYLASERITF